MLPLNGRRLRALWGLCVLHDFLRRSCRTRPPCILPLGSLHGHEGIAIYERLEGQSGRPGWLPTPAPLGSGGAQLTHPALRLTGSLLFGRLSGRFVAMAGDNAYTAAERPSSPAWPSGIVGYTLKRHLRRRSAVEPEIGHMKSDGLLRQNFLKGTAGDAINAMLCGAGHNLRKILARLRALLYLLDGQVRKAIRALLAHMEVHVLPQQALKAA